MTDKEIERRAKQLLKVAKDKNCVSVERDGERAIFHFSDGSIFKCSGPLVELAPIVERKKRGLLF